MGLAKLARQAAECVRGDARGWMCLEYRENVGVMARRFAGDDDGCTYVCINVSGACPCGEGVALL